jgi:signal transduction histidine kinase
MELRRLTRARPLRRHAAAVDVAVAAGLAVFGVAETAILGDYSPRWGWALAACLTGAALLGRRRWPLPTLVTVLALLAVTDFTTTTDADPGFPFFAVLIACFSVGAYASVPAAIAGTALVIVDYVVGVLIGGEVLSDLVFVGFVILGSVALGRALAERNERLDLLAREARRLEAEREARAREAVLEERARIARELHDVVAHSMSMVVLQVGAVRRLLTPAQEREREALLGVEATGRQALAEMRRLLGIQRRAEEASGFAPQPSLSQLDELLGHVRDAGLPVELRIEGAAGPLPPGLDLSAYRIVQEALTNTLKHAGPAHATVVVRYGERALELEVLDDGRGAHVNGDGAGHGLIGMRERAALYGGELAVAARDEGGWAVRARLPLGAEA